ncbi:MAG: FAD-binding protein [Rhodospirillaceae bacterium]|nr:FAD-binding protein [Rhodospirillaceae bacterium]
MAEFDALFAPLKIRHLTIRNRIVSTSHAPAYAEDAMPGERYQLYHLEKAKGGIGMTMFGGSSTVSPDCPATFGQLDVSTDRVVPYFKDFSRRVHEAGAALMCQITHMGRRTRWDSGHWLPPVAPSAVREPEHRSFPKAMEPFDIRRVIRDFAAAAARCKAGGLDGVELSFSGTHLIEQFWSPLSNRREDEYGGSFENRMRLSLEVLDAVRRAVGEEFIISIRLVGDQMLDGGLSAEDCLAIAERLAATGQVDILNVMAGSVQDYRLLALNILNMSFPNAPYLHLPSAIRARVKIPVLHAGKVPDLATAARAIEEGRVDLVAMTRAHMADPHIVRKLTEGRAEDIRQCVGANYCIDRIYTGGEALCIQNPATGREAALPHRVSRGPGGKTVVVAGAGCAGLEAARVAALRGHRVVLFEAAAQTGGQVDLAARATWRQSLTGITRWLDGQVRKAGIDLRLNIEATVEAVAAERPDIVIVATGGRQNKGTFAGAEHAVGTWDILRGAVEPGDSVLLYDDHGDHRGPSVAELIASRGGKVEIATPERYLGVEFGATNWPVHLRELYAMGVVMTPDMRLVAVYPEGNRLVAVLRNEYTLEEEERAVDQVVAEHGTLPNDDLYAALAPDSVNLGEVDLDALIAGSPQTLRTNPDGAFQLFRVGDAVASRNIHAAIYESLRLCRAI